MFHLMLGSRLRCRSWVCDHLARQMLCIYQVNIHGIAHLNALCMDSFKSSLQNNNWRLFNNRQKSSLSFIHFKNSKAFYSSKPINIAGKKSVDQVSDAIKTKKPKKELKTFITLLGVDNSMSITTVEEAKKLAGRRNYTLEKIKDFDPKNGRAVYILMTESQYLQYVKNDWEDNSSNNSNKEQVTKDEKLVSLSSNTNENDVLTKLKMIKKWLTKKLEVRVIINGDTTSGENVYKIVERELGSMGRIVQKRVKSSSIRFQILLPKKSGEKVAEKTDNE